MWHQITFTRRLEYVFHHPLIRTVAHEAQLKSDRAELHPRVAAAIESHDSAAADGNAALISEHLEAAGDLREAFGWHGRSDANTTRSRREMRASGGAPSCMALALVRYPAGGKKPAPVNHPGCHP